MTDVVQGECCEDSDPEGYAGEDIDDGWFTAEGVTPDGVDPGALPGQPAG